MNIVYPPSSYSGLEILSCSGGHQFEKHLHDGYVLWLNSETGEHYSVNGGNNILQLGSVSVIEPGVAHANRSCVEGNSHLRSFYCTEKFLQTQYARIYGDGYSPPLGTRVVEDATLWRELTVLHDTLLGTKADLGADELALATLSRLFERCGGRELRPLRDNGDKRVATVIEYFHAHLDSPVLLDDLAMMLGCTSYHLIRLFRLQKGMTPHAYLTQLRLEKARILLEQGSTILNAALQTGLSDQSHLTRQFKKRYGVTPGQYKKQRLLE